MDLRELADRAEKADGPDTDIDVAIQSALSGVPNTLPPGHRWNTTLGYTSSIDAAVTLVPEGSLHFARTVWGAVNGDQAEGFAGVSLYEYQDGRRYWITEFQATAATPRSPLPPPLFAPVPLTETQARNARASDKPVKLSDANGLFLLVSATGHKSWRWKYRFQGKEGLKVLGRYPEMSLREAREERARLDKERRAGKSPAAKPPPPPETVTFEAVALRWHKQQSGIWKPKHAGNVLRQVRSDLFPALGAKSIKDISAKQVLAVLRKVEERGAVDRAHRHKQRLEEIFALAVAEELMAHNPAAALGRKALSPVVVRRYPALTTLADARALLQAMDEGPATDVVKLANRFMAATAARSEAIRYAEWSEIEGDVWRIPAEHMKLKKAQQADPTYEFLVPLPPQTKAVLDAVQPLTGNRKLIFGGMRDPDKPMSDATLSMAIRRLPGWGGRHVPHGWRSTFSTIMNEWASEHGRPGDREVIDLMLAHIRGGVEGRYNRSEHLPRRRELSDIWSKMLLG